MHVEMSYEGDNSWEQHQNIYRVYFFKGPGPSYPVITFDISDATFSEAMRWADDEACDRLYSIALISSNDQGERGLVWLIGNDANDVLDTTSAEADRSVEIRLRREMEENRLRRI